MTPSSFLFLSLFGSVGYNILIRHGSQHINPYVFAVGMTAGTSVIYFPAFLLFGPPLEEITLRLSEVAIMMGAGVSVAIGDLFFYLVLARNVPISTVLPLVFISKTLLVTFVDTFFFQTPISSLQWVGIMIGIGAIYFLTHYTKTSNNTTPKSVFKFLLNVPSITVTALFLTLAILGGSGFMLLAELGSRGLNVFVFTVGHTIAASLVRLIAYVFLGPSLKTSWPGWHEHATMLSAGAVIAIGDMLFYMSLVYGIGISIAMPIMFIGTLAVVTLIEKLFFNVEIPSLKWIGIFLGMAAIVCLVQE